MGTQIQNAPARAPAQRVDLPVGGMNCASCAARIEKTLNGVPGVDSASVNFATSTATVQYDPARVGVPELCAAVQDAGYTATPPREEGPGAALDEEQARKVPTPGDARTANAFCLIGGGGARWNETHPGMKAFPYYPMIVNMGSYGKHSLTGAEVVDRPRSP